METARFAGASLTGALMDTTPAFSPEYTHMKDVTASGGADGLPLTTNDVLDAHLEPQSLGPHAQHHCLCGL